MIDDAEKLRAQIPYSTDPTYHEDMARDAEENAVTIIGSDDKAVARTIAAADHDRAMGFIDGIMAALGGIGGMITAQKKPGGRGDATYIEALDDVILMLGGLLAEKRKT